MKAKADTLLINPAYFGNRYSLPYPGIGYIASALEGIGCNVKLIDCQVTPDYKKRIILSLVDYPVVGISVNAGNVSIALDIAKAIRNQSPSTRIIMGGPHATAVYDILIPEYADIVVRGEGEDTVTELMQQEDLSGIKGIAYWDGELKVNPPRPYIEDLDRLRFPAWHLYELRKYHFGSSNIPFTLIFTSRGCPYDCIHCTKFIHGYKVRVRSIINVMDEIEYLVSELDIKEILIEDDLFAFYPERVKEFCREIIARKYKDLRFAIHSGIRPDFEDQEVFNLLAEAGCYLVGIGIESGSQEVLDKLGRNFDIDRLRKVIVMIKRAGLKVDLYFMLGLPFDTVETMRETIEVAQSLPANGASFLFTIPFVGTKLYEMVCEKGRFLTDLITNSVGYEAKPVYEMDTFKAKDVEKMFKLAHRKFYLRPMQIWNMINNLSKVKSPKIALRLIKEAFRLIYLSVCSR